MSRMPLLVALFSFGGCLPPVPGAGKGGADSAPVADEDDGDEGDEGDEGDDFDDCAHEWLNAAGICFDCGAEVGAHSTAFPATPFQPKE